MEAPVAWRVFVVRAKVAEITERWSSFKLLVEVDGGVAEVVVDGETWYGARVGVPVRL